MPLPTTNLGLDDIHVEVGGTTGTTASLNDSDIRGIGAPDPTYAPSGINTTSGTTISMGQFRNAQDSFNIGNSLKVEDDNNEWMYRTPSASGTQTKFTFSFWFKRSDTFYFSADPYFFSQGSNARFHFANDTIRFMWAGGSTELEASAKLRDTNAWYHIVLAVDTTQATASNRVKAYLNGQAYAWNNTKYPAQNSTSTWMSTTSLYISTRDGDGAYDNSGYWSEVCIVDGQQLDPTSFGEYDSASAIWKPKDISGLNFGSQGFYLNFSNAASLGADSSGNGNNFTLSNISSADQATDTPTNNFCTLNNKCALASVTYGEGNTEGSTIGAGDEPGEGSMIFSSGKWYFETSVPTSSPNADAMFGFGRPNLWGTNSAYPGSDAYAFSYHSNGNVYYNSTATSGWAGFAKGNIVMVAIDADNGFAYFGVNGTWGNSGVPTSGSSGTGGFNYVSNVPYMALGDDIVPAFRIHYNTYSKSQYNFGGFTTISIASGATDGNGYGTFEYAPPTGYYALCTKNLAEYG